MSVTQRLTDLLELQQELIITKLSINKVNTVAMPQKQFDEFLIEHRIQSKGLHHVCVIGTYGELDVYLHTYPPSVDWAKNRAIWGCGVKHILNVDMIANPTRDMIGYDNCRNPVTLLENYFKIIGDAGHMQSDNCDHAWIQYHGLFEGFEYCAKCDARKGV